MTRTPRPSLELLEASQAAWDCFGEWLGTLDGHPYLRPLLLEVCGRDLCAAYLLEQLVFWVRPSKTTGKRKTVLVSTVVKTDYDFAEELFIKPKSVGTARRHLKKAGYIRCYTAKSPFYGGGRALHYAVLAGPVLVAVAELIPEWRDLWARANPDSPSSIVGEPMRPAVTLLRPVPITVEELARHAKRRFRPSLERLEAEIPEDVMPYWDAYKCMVDDRSETGRVSDNVLVDHLLRIHTARKGAGLTWDDIAHGLDEAITTGVPHPSYVVRIAREPKWSPASTAAVP